MAAALRNTHQVKVVCQLILPGQSPVTVQVTGGQVTGDRTSQIRRTGTVTLPWRPDLPAGILPVDLRQLPFGSYCDLRRGVAYPDGTSDVVRLGYFRVNTVSYGTDDAEAELSMSDRMVQVQDEPLQWPLTANGKLPARYAGHLAVESTSLNGQATITINVPDAAQPTLQDVTFDQDRAGAVATLCRAVSAEGYFDTAGNFRVDPIPDPNVRQPVWVIDAGSDGILVSADESYDRSGVFNGVLVRGQATTDSVPYRALVTVSDPSNPMRWGGPFGNVLHIEDSNAYHHYAQAVNAGTTMLYQQLGLQRSITLHAVPNPALAPSDCVQVEFPDGRIENHVIDVVRIPLGPEEPIELATRLVYTPASTMFTALSGSEAITEAAKATEVLVGA
jgi:hypothetical protein